MLRNREVVIPDAMRYRANADMNSVTSESRVRVYTFELVTIDRRFAIATLPAGGKAIVPQSCSCAAMGVIAENRYKSRLQT